MSHLHPVVPSATELRAISRRYRRSRGASDVDARDGGTASGGWLDAVDEPFESVDGTLARLREVENDLLAAGDRRSVFLTVYTEMTAAVRDGIESGFFDDPAWIRRYLVAFANRYRAAVVAYERGNRGAVPEPWRVGFDATLHGTPFVLQDALLGVNAHINYDLAYTLERVGIRSNRRAKRRDHDRINEILARLVDAVQDALVSVYDAEGVDGLDAFFGSLDEALALHGLREGRQFAWENAVLLTDYDWSVVTRFVGWRVTGVSTGAAYVLLGPTVDASTGERAVVGGAEESGLDDFRSAFREYAPDGAPDTWAAVE